MNTQEIQEQLQDNQEATLRIEERVTQLENKEIKFPEIKDYDRKLDELKTLIGKQGEQDKTLPLRETIKEQAGEIARLVSTTRELIQSHDNIVQELPKEIRTTVLHRFEDKTKGFIIGGIVLLIVAALSTGIALHLWSENGRMRENDVKFRMVRQTNPDVAYTIDTLYYRNPEEMEAKTKQMEAGQLAIAQAEAAAKEKEGQAKEAKQKLKKLKKK